MLPVCGPLALALDWPGNLESGVTMSSKRLKTVNLTKIQGNVTEKILPLGMKPRTFHLIWML